MTLNLLCVVLSPPMTVLRPEGSPRSVRWSSGVWQRSDFMPVAFSVLRSFKKTPSFRQQACRVECRHRSADRTYLWMNANNQCRQRQQQQPGDTSDTQRTAAVNRKNSLNFSFYKKRLGLRAQPAQGYCDRFESVPESGASSF